MASKGDIEEDEETREQGQTKIVGFRERVRHFTWAWFTSTMSTGGLALLIANTPHKFHGLYTIGLIIFFLNIILFLTLSTLMALRAYFDLPRFLKSFAHPPEGFFFGSFWLSIATIIGGIQVFGISQGPAYPWLINTVRVLYWMYAGITLPNSILQYWIFMHRRPISPLAINPSWFLPAYSAMLTGTVASLIAGTQPLESRMPIIVSGVAYKSFGMMMAFLLTVLYFSALMEKGLPPPHLRPGMFIPLGSAAYTTVALIGLANAIPRDYGYFEVHPMAVDVLQTMALFVGIFLWIYMFWIFSMAALSCATVIPKMGFSLTWWAFIFPNVGFTLATADIGRELGSEGVMWVGSVMTVLVVAIWLVTVTACVRAVWAKRIMWPGKDEDKDL
ncbi:C4-dicarboxylate transporter/malic acid transport protein-like protein [Amniculicola lignicola CBS 123094]|uniref:C4-dicarboxylate transporter/malic acid transport protein-like protein n=1 Tax=Amniculicola lignicola CBS 123094 TaxID=1392246 RepID=A0A6A5W5M4_9PLEO|nr:C4-dicarboxylate transporter/malic acid transport protein-like protein [Amniculicola lignicola CBS 123094]